jgi:hypothetical protein
MSTTRVNQIKRILGFCQLNGAKFYVINEIKHFKRKLKVFRRGFTIKKDKNIIIRALSDNNLSDKEFFLRSFIVSEPSPRIKGAGLNKNMFALITL